MKTIGRTIVFLVCMLALGAFFAFNRALAPNGHRIISARSGAAQATPAQVGPSLSTIVAPDPTPVIAPPGRIDHTLASDPVRNGVLMFGGSAAPATTVPRIFLGDTWFWNGRAWQLLTPPVAPTPRASPAIAFDPSLGTAILFGGIGPATPRGEALLNDTWAWDGISWSELHPAHAPPARARASLVADPASHRLLLFGGAGNASAMHDMWAWTGTDWVALDPGPTAAQVPSGAVLVPDPLGGFVAVGNCSSDRTAPNRFRFDGKAFGSETHPEDNLVAARCVGAVGSDTRRRQLVVFGGTYQYVDSPFTGSTDQRDSTTLTFDGYQWSSPTVTNTPLGRQRSAMAFDPASQSVLLFGGDGGSAGRVLSDTWTWDGKSWSRR